MKGSYRKLSEGERSRELEAQWGRQRELKLRSLALDMTRGKPCREQLDLCADLLTCVDGSSAEAEDGTDCRNYGGLDGIPEAKRLFAEFMEVSPGEIIVGGNSSLTLMYAAIVRAMLHGVAPDGSPWKALPPPRFLCPSPGYDRHFTICEQLGIEMVPVEMTDDGPDMDQVEQLVSSDSRVKAMWCVPRYSNPTGVTYSNETVERLATMPTAAPDFRILWDNAYAVHHLTDSPQPLTNILAACKKAGCAARPLMFGSTSKISMAGAGVGFFAASETNVADLRKGLSAQMIGPDKINQLRHVRFFGDMDGIRAHMERHAAIIRPKFDAVRQTLESEVAGKGIASWSNPSGGYFFSLDVPDGCASKVVALARDTGVALTPAGATFPYRQDPRDRNLRIAPTMPGPDEIVTAMEVVAIAVRIVALEELS